MHWTGNLKKVLHYHENKVRKGMASLIYAGNFLRTPAELRWDQKVKRFTDLSDLNQRSTKKMIHLSLNFHPAETPRLTDELLRHISADYMEKIGYGEQPFLVYRHFDAWHPHVHILAAAVKPDGRCIDLYGQAEKIFLSHCRELEQQYGLIPPGNRRVTGQQHHPSETEVQRAVYGKTEHLRTMTTILESVMTRYQYTSLEAFNAALRPYNVMGIRLRSRQNGATGLMYAMIDMAGHIRGNPILSSAIPFKPTLKNLEKRFTANKKNRIPYRNSLISRIRWACRENPENMRRLAGMLEEEQIILVVRHNDQGRVHGFTYVDQEHHTVFDERDLGKEYSAAHLLARFGTNRDRNPLLEAREREQTRPKTQTDQQHWLVSRFPRLSVATDLPEGSVLAELFHRPARDQEQSLQQANDRALSRGNVPG